MALGLIREPRSSCSARARPEEGRIGEGTEFLFEGLEPARELAPHLRDIHLYWSKQPITSFYARLDYSIYILYKAIFREYFLGSNSYYILHKTQRSFFYLLYTLKKATEVEYVLESAGEVQVLLVQYLTRK